MKRIFLFSCLQCLLFVGVAHAQVQVGLRVSPSVSALRSPLKNEDSSAPFYVLVAAGMFVQIGDSRNVRFFAEAEYQPKRIPYNLTQPVKSDHMRVQYVTLGPGIRFYTPDILVGSRLFAEMAARTHMRVYQDFIKPQGANLDKVRYFNVSLRWGAGFMMDWRERVSFFGIIGYERGLTNALAFEEPQYDPKSDTRLDAFSISIGIVF